MTITVPRTFGGTLIITYTPAAPPNATVFVRSGLATATVRSGLGTATVRSGLGTVYVRKD